VPRTVWQPEKGNWKIKNIEYKETQGSGPFKHALILVSIQKQQAIIHFYNTELAQYKPKVRFQLHDEKDWMETAHRLLLSAVDEGLVQANGEYSFCASADI
jgi:hypothetical protein